MSDDSWMKRFLGEEIWSNGKLFCTRDSDVFVFTEPGYVKVISTLNKQVKTLAFNSFSMHEPKQVKFNSTGNFLAVAAEHAIIVLSVPSILTDGKVLESFKVGELDIDTDLQRFIVSIHWHPLSRDDSHVVTCMSNGTIRVFDLNRPKHPESSFHFQENYSERGIGVLDMDFVAYDFGRAGFWGGMTLYGLTQSGDVFSLCPILPKHASVNRELLEHTINALSKEFTEHSEDEEPLDELLWQLNTQISFLKHLKQTAISAEDDRSLHVNFHDPGNSLNEQLKKRRSFPVFVKPLGPYSFTPLPEDTLDVKDAADFRILGVKEGGLEVEVVSVLFESGVVYFGLLGLGSYEGGFWTSEQDSEAIQAQIYLVESLKIDMEHAHFVTDESEFFYARNDKQIVSFDISTWLNKLFTVLLSKEDSSPSFLGDDQQQTEVIGLITCSPDASVSIRCAGFINELSGYAMLVTIDDELVIIDLGFMRLPKIFLPTEQQIESDNTQSLLREIPIEQNLPCIQRVSTKEGYEITINPVFKKGGLVSQPKPKPSDLKYPDIVDKTSFELVSKATGDLRDTMRELSEFAIGLKTRVELVQKEHQRLEELSVKLSSDLTDESFTQLKERATKVKAAQERVMKRVDLLLSIAMEYKSPQLNAAELKWMEELETHRKQLKTLHARFVKIKETINRLPKIKPDSEFKIGDKQLEQFKPLLEKETRFLEDLVQKTRELEIKVDLLD